MPAVWIALIGLALRLVADGRGIMDSWSEYGWLEESGVAESGKAGCQCQWCWILGALNGLRALVGAGKWQLAVGLELASVNSWHRVS